MKYENAYPIAAKARKEVDDLPRLLNGLKQTITRAAVSRYASDSGFIINEVEVVREKLRAINDLLVQIDTEMRT